MKQSIIRLLHLGVWIMLLFSDIWKDVAGSNIVLSKEWHEHSIFSYSVINILYLILPIICFYGSYLKVAPLLMLEKKLIKAAALTILILAVIVAYRYFIEYFVFLPVFGFDNYNGHQWKIAHFIQNVFFYYFPTYFVYGLMYFFVENWYQSRRRQLELKNELADAELALLRSQINPHFLFNCINDIYSLAYTKSESASIALLKLADILRYMLMVSGKQFIELQDELNYLQNVISLHQLTSKGSSQIEINFEGDNTSRKISPLIYIAFLENALKHGVLNDQENPVTITHTAAAATLCLTVTNKKNFGYKDQTGGIGLMNVKRRLELIYPMKHNLLIRDDSDYYQISLILEVIA